MLPALLLAHLAVLEGEHRSLQSVSAPGFGENVAATLTVINLCIQPTHAVRLAVAAIRENTARLGALITTLDIRTYEVEVARQAALSDIGTLRVALVGVLPSVGAQLAGQGW